MTTKADYTNEEWQLLANGPMLAGHGISLLEKGLIADLREHAAIERAIEKGKDGYHSNALVQAVIADHRARGDEGKKAPEGETPESVLAKLVQIDGILDRHAAGDDAKLSEAIGYRNFLYEIADQAANASGGFLGLGDKVSDDERYFLKKLKEVLFREPNPAS